MNTTHSPEQDAPEHTHHHVHHESCGHAHHDHEHHDHTHHENGDHAHHAHHHDDGCDCPDCASDTASAVTAQALRFGKSASLTFEQACGVSQLEQCIIEAINHIAEQLSIENVIPGHIKALLQYEDKSIAFSSTMVGEVAVLPTAGASREDVTDMCIVTLNAISALPGDVDLDALWEQLLDELAQTAH